jgi:hypothetical protein
VAAPWPHLARVGLSKVHRFGIWYLLIILVLEKIIQHVVVTMAFLFNWDNINSQVAVSPSFLMVAGAVVAAFFGLSLWGLIIQRGWAIRLLSTLAIFDLVGEFVAQSRIDIVVTVSFAVAAALLILTLLYRRQQRLERP